MCGINGVGGGGGHNVVGIGLTHGLQHHNSGSNGI